MRRICFIDMLQAPDAGTEALSFYIFRVEAGGLELEREFKETLPALSRSVFAGVDEFYLNIPLNALSFRILELPFKDKEKIRKVVPIELEGLLLSGQGEPVFDVVPLEGKGVLVIFLAARRLRDVITGLNSSGIDPCVITSYGLRVALKRGANEIAGYLMAPDELSRDERLHAMKEEARAPLINLRTGPVAYTKDTEGIKKKLRVTASLALILALLINMFLLYRTMTYRRESSVIRSEIRSIYTTLFPEEKRISDELYQMRSNIKSAKERADAFAGVRALHFLKEVSKKMAGGIVFSEVNISAETVTMRGETASMESLGKAKEALTELMADIKISDIKNSAEGKTVFTLTGRLRVS